MVTSTQHKGSAMIGLTFDEALVKRVGQFGPGQLRILSCSSLSLLANAAAFFFWVFATVNPITHKNWECVAEDNAVAACQAVREQEVPSSQDFCALPAQSWHWTSHDSLVARFNLVCADAWKVQFTNSLMFMGALVGSGVFGILCDHFGRRRPLFLATALIAASMSASLAAPSYWVFAVLRAVTGFGAAGQSHCNFLLSTESVGPAFRGLAGILALAFFIVGEFVMVALAFALPAWQHLLIACASLNAATLLLYPLVPESGRWLLSRGRTEEARQALQRIAAGNKSQLPTEPLVSSSSSACSKQQDFAAAEEARGSCSDAGTSTSGGSEGSSEPPVKLVHLLRHPRMAGRLLVLLITSFTLMLNYYGISLGAGGIPGSIYMTFAVGAAAEFAAIAVVGPSVDHVGRHNIVAIGQLLGGAACLACAMVKGGTIQAALAAVGKFGCSAAQSVNGTYIAELLPTSCRSSVMGICSQAARVGSIAAPFLLMAGAQMSVAGKSQVFIPFMVFGCLAVLSGLLTLTMPETLGASMPENVRDLEQLLSVFTAKPWRDGWTATIAFVFRTRAAITARVFSPRQSDTGDASSTCPSSYSCDTAAPDVLAHISLHVVPDRKAPAKGTPTDDRQVRGDDS